MIDEPDLPPGVGPHEGRELELMLAGQKPLAMFYDVIPASFDLPEADFAPHVASGRIVMREEIYTSVRTGDTSRYLYYALPSEAWRMNAMHRLQFAFHAGQRTTEAVEIEIGRLLGYADADIQMFPPAHPASQRTDYSLSLLLKVCSINASVKGIFTLSL